MRHRRKSTIAGHNTPFVPCGDRKGCLETSIRSTNPSASGRPITAARSSRSSTDTAPHQTLTRNCHGIRQLAEATAILMLDEFEYDPLLSSKAPRKQLKNKPRSPGAAMAQLPKTQMACRFWPGPAVGEMCKLACKVLKQRKDYRMSESVERCESRSIVTLESEGENFADSNSSRSYD